MRAARQLVPIVALLFALALPVGTPRRGLLGRGARVLVRCSRRACGADRDGSPVIL